MKKSDYKVDITFTFNADDLQELLNSANFGEEDGALKLEDLSKEKLADFYFELQQCASNFKEEIIETSDEACANDWLCEFRGE